MVAAIRDEAGGVLKRFYAARGYRPLWASDGRVGPAADTLLGYIDDARRDGLKPSRYHPDDLREAVRRARAADAGARQVAAAELGLSRTLARFVRDQRRSRVKMIWADRALKPVRPDDAAVLRAAAFPKSFAGYIADMAWMSPQYVRLRALNRDDVEATSAARLRINMDRARLLPGPWTAHVEVDASSGQLWFYDAGRQRGAMRVVVGAKATQTPMMAGTLQWAILNPYWNVPTYLARQSIAPKVLAGRSLASMHMEALSDWSTAAQPVKASAVDWQAVADGRQEIRLRELPGAGNSMGRVKFLFPNDEGIYLHDTPDRALLTKPDRHFSNGCIRLEKADELGRWLMQRPLPRAAGNPERAVPLPMGVPVYLTYLTAHTGDDGLSFRPDIYERD